MQPSIVIGLVILLATIVIAWLLARFSGKGPRKKDAECPHCGERIPHDARVCPSCSKEIHKCVTCNSPMGNEDLTCEVCGEAAHKGAAAKYVCPKCEAPVAPRARKCKKCGEHFWSPVVAGK